MKEEFLYHVDWSDKVIGRQKRSEFLDSGKVTRSVDVFLFDRKGRILLQKRSPDKQIAPNKLTSSVSGFVKYGESREKAAHRETKEELGIDVPLRLRYIRFADGRHRKGIISVFTGKIKGKINFDKREISSLHYFTQKELFYALKQKEIFDIGTRKKISLFLDFWKGRFFWEKRVWIRDTKGKKLCGILTVPVHENVKVPIVVMCHGFSSNKDSNTYMAMADLLALKGIASFRIDLPGRGESQGKFRDVTVTSDYKALKTAIDYVDTLGFVDTTRIGLLGSSAGGASVLIGAARNKVKSLVMFCPVSDWKNHMTRDRIWDTWDSSMDEWKIKGFMKKYSEKNKKMKYLDYKFYKDAVRWDLYKEAAKIRCPVLIVHGGNDVNVLFEQSRELLKHIKSERKLLEIKGANHYFDNPKHRIIRHEAAIDWFLKHL